MFSNIWKFTRRNRNIFSGDLTFLVLELEWHPKEKFYPSADNFTWALLVTLVTNNTATFEFRVWTQKVTWDPSDIWSEWCLQKESFKVWCQGSFKIAMFFSCPADRPIGGLVTDWLNHFWFLNISQAILDVRELPRRLVTFDRFEHSDKETWSDQKRSTLIPSSTPIHLPTYLSTSIIEHP